MHGVLDQAGSQCLVGFYVHVRYMSSSVRLSSVVCLSVVCL